MENPMAPPTIRISQRALEGIESLREAASPKNTLNGVVEHLLARHNALPKESSENQQEPPSQPKYRSQRHAMRELYERCSGQEDKVIEMYASLENKGWVKRRSDTYGINPRAYAQALLNDGKKKGWLFRKGSIGSTADNNSVDATRLIVKKRWLGQDLSVRIHDKTSGDTFCYPHDGLIEQLKTHAPAIFETASWRDTGQYHWPSIPPEKGKYACIRPFLARYREIIGK